VVIVLAALALVVANRWGAHLDATGRSIDVRVPPLYAVADPHVSAAHVVVIAGGLVLVVAVTRAAREQPFRRALVASSAAAAAWTVLVNSTRGLSALTAPLESRHDYLADVGGSPLAVFGDFARRYDTFAVHTRGHPPGFLALLTAADGVGLGGSRWAAVLCVAGGAGAVAAVAVTVRDVAGEATARRALPFVALAPVALWFGSSADAFFTGLGAAAVAVLTRAVLRPRRPGLALAGGALLGAAMLCTYGAALLVGVPAAVPAAAGVATVLLCARAAGFDYAEGLRSTRAEYLAGVASARPYSYALVANLAAFAVVLGPATLAGLRRARGLLAVVAAGAGAAVVTADVSGMTKLEVERIWLPFAVWLLPAAGLVATGARMERRWLSLQAGWALAVQTMVRTGW
jgi:hypothetical protein